MGAEQSTPTGSYQPDFMTAHVKKVQSGLTPQRQPLQGFSSFGADSLQVSQAKQAQKDVSGTPSGKGTKQHVGLPGSMIDNNSYFEREMRSVTQTLAQSSRPQPMGKPSVGGDSIYMKAARDASSKQDNALRNRFALGDTKGKEALFVAKLGGNNNNHCDGSGYETNFAKEMKKHTRGPTYEGRGQRSPDVGKPTAIKNGAYYIDFAKTTHSWLAPKTAPKVVAEWQGIKPTLPVDDYVRDEIKAKRGEIAMANTPLRLPAPQVGPDAYMLREAKALTDAISSSPNKYSEASAPYSYNPTDSASFFSTATPGSKMPEDDQYQGVKAHGARPARARTQPHAQPHARRPDGACAAAPGALTPGPSLSVRAVGADSFMNTFAKDTAEMIPTTTPSRELHAVPPREELFSA